MNESQAWLNDRQDILLEKWRNSLKKPIAHTSEHDHRTYYVKQPKPTDGENEWDFRRRCLEWLGFKTYEDYLESDLWKEIRLRVMKKSRWHCASCGLAAKVVHHQRYTSRGLKGTSDKWLLALCHECHSKQHERGWGTIGVTKAVKRVSPNRKERRAKLTQALCMVCRCLMKKGLPWGSVHPKCRR